LTDISSTHSCPFAWLVSDRRTCGPRLLYRSMGLVIRP